MRFPRAEALASMALATTEMATHVARSDVERFKWQLEVEQARASGNNVRPEQLVPQLEGQREQREGHRCPVRSFIPRALLRECGAVIQRRQGAPRK